MATTATQEDVNRLVETIRGLKNRDLVRICAENYLAKSGNKADLQRRICALIDSAVTDPNARKFAMIKNSVLQVASSSSGIGYRTSGFAYSSLPSSPSFNGNLGVSSPYPLAAAVAADGTATAVNDGHSNGHHGGSGYVHQGLQFKISPFYEIDTALGNVTHCEVMAQNRNTITVIIRAVTFPELQRCITDSTLRIMVFCAASNNGVQDITFPYQCEIMVNGSDVKANVRGLKNKPGSTRPVDITDMIRLKPPNYTNSLEFNYALTNKRFYLGLYLCKTYSVELLASRIGKRSRITKESVIREITRQARDPDIVATSTVLSLKCPLTYMRLSFPIRATTCRHIQCFDVTSYLQLQEQGPQWLCPVCSNPASYDSLAIDEYVQDILDNTPADLEQVTIEPNGNWHTGKSKDCESFGNGGRNSRSRMPSTPSRVGEVSCLDDDDVANDVAVTTPEDSRYGKGHAHGSGYGYGYSNGNGLGVSPLVTTSVASRDTTATPSQTGLGSTSKRPRAEVIDLTLSDDEDEAELQPPPVKRQNTTTSSNSNPFQMPLPTLPAFSDRLLNQ